jgi:hypothetical protein
MTGDDMSEASRFGAPAGHPAGERSDDYGFFAPERAAAPAHDGATTAAPFTPGQAYPDAPPFQPARSGLPVWAIALIGVGGLFALGIVASVALPAFLSGRQQSKLAASTVSTPTTLLGLARSADPATQSQAAQLAAGIPSGFTQRQSAGYAGGSATLIVAAAKPQHVLTLAEQASLTRSFWANEAASVPDGSSLAAPSTPAGAGATGALTCADEITADGAATVCIDVQATALVVFVLASTSGQDPTAPAQVPPAVVHAG